MSRAFRRIASCLAPALAVLSPAAPAAAATPRVVQLRGTAYEFNSAGTVLGGATIRVAEFPRLRARVRGDGSYVLPVPDRARVTPYIEARGHHTIYLQTFRTRGEDLENVNFQTPSDVIYGALAALLRVRLDAAGLPAACAIVSTFSTRNVRDLGFRAFIRYGAHGVAGATAVAAPRLPPPLYFNAQVIPDPAQALSSPDGGVIWTEVPAGTYTITARHPRTRFAPFLATCAPGRIVNANPPWGLHELGLPNPARVTATWSRTRRGAMLHALRASALPRGAVVRVRCVGAGCAPRARRLVPRGTRADLLRGTDVPAALRAGQTLEVEISVRRHDGTVVRWPVPAHGLPRAHRLCVPLGNTAARPRC